MDATTSLKLFELTLEFMKDRKKAKEFVTQLEETVEVTFNGKKHDLATKKDIFLLKQDILLLKQDILLLENKLGTRIYKVGLLQFVAIMASIFAMLKYLN